MMNKGIDMSVPTYDVHAPKKATNLTVNADLLAQARAMKLNLSKELELCLIERLKQRHAEQWRAENQAAIDEYNARIEREGVFSDGLRIF